MCQVKSGKVIYISNLLCISISVKKKGGGEKVRKNTNFQLSHEIGLVQISTFECRVSVINPCAYKVSIM